MQRRLECRAELLAFLDQLLVAIADGADRDHVFSHRVACFLQRLDAAGENRVVHSVDKVDAFVAKRCDGLCGTLVSVGLTEAFVNVTDDGQVRTGDRFLEGVDR